VPGFVEFAIEDERLTGAFQFGTVIGWSDCRLRRVDGVMSVEWSWGGQSDTDPASGRGWATIVDGELVGRVFIHCADDSAFKGRHQTRTATRLESSRVRSAVKPPGSPPS
jgi:hypothetical protein